MILCFVLVPRQVCTKPTLFWEDSYLPFPNLAQEWDYTTHDMLLVI